MKTPTLDSIVDNMTTASASTREQLATTAAADAAVDKLAASLVPGETDETTYTAIATLYDMKRDRAVLALTTLCEAYGEEMNKRELHAIHAAPLIAEMMKVLDVATAAQVRALNHRCAAGSARDKTPPAKGSR